MVNTENWANVSLMTSLFDERTVKFKVQFRASNLRGIVKVPQLQFPLEPFSELAAFHADRVLGQNRVPPTGWTLVPMSWLLDAIQRHPDPSHVSFVATEFTTYASSAHLVRQWKGTPSLEVSVQLWMVDVHHFLDSIYVIPYKAHNRSWHRYFDPRFGYPESVTIGIHHLSQTVTFDFVIGNNDRSPNKNCYVAGGCLHRRCRRTRKRPYHPGPPDFLFLDHGMSFYHGSPPKDNPLSLVNSTFCVFRRGLIRSLLNLSAPVETCTLPAADVRDPHPSLPALPLTPGEGSAPPCFSTLLWQRLPLSVRRRLGWASVGTTQSRLRHVLHRVEECLGQWPAETVLKP
eukprot:RCo010395